MNQDKAVCEIAKELGLNFSESNVSIMIKLLEGGIHRIIDKDVGGLRLRLVAWRYKNLLTKCFKNYGLVFFIESLQL